MLAVGSLAAGSAFTLIPLFSESFRTLGPTRCSQQLVWAFLSQPWTQPLLQSLAGCLETASGCLFLGGGGGSWETSCHRQSLPGRPPRPPVLSSQPAYGGPGPPRVGMFAPDHQLCWQISRGGTCRAASTGLRGMSGALRRGYGGHTPGTLALRSRCRGRWPQCARPCWGLDRC